MTTLALTAILAAALVPLIRRDVRRAVARRRRREIRALVEALRGKGRITMRGER